MVVVRHWPLYQLDIKNDFLHGDIEDEVYMSNHLALLLTGSLVTWCADYDEHFTA